MESLDPSSIDSQSTLGQLTVLIIAIVSLITAIRPLLKNPKNVIARRNYSSLVDEVKAAKKETAFTRKINRNLVEWQISARELIRILRNAIIESGATLPDRVLVLSAFLEKIESEDLYTDLEDITNDTET